MPLPEITLPPGTPAFLADEHSIELLPAHGDQPMGTGHSRKRRLFTGPPRIVNVALVLLSQARMAALDAWFENDLQVGTAEFAAEVKHQGFGVRWWTARWAEPFKADPLPGGRLWKVTGRLYLTGAPSLTAPLLTGFAAEISVELAGTAELSVPKVLAAEISVELEEG